MRKTKYASADGCNYLTLKQASAIFNFSAFTIDRLARECGAKIKVGRSARYLRDKLECYLLTNPA